MNGTLQTAPSLPLFLSIGARSKEFILKKIITEIEKASIVPALEPLR